MVVTKADGRSDLGLQSSRSSDLRSIRSEKLNFSTALLEILDGQHIYSNKGFSPAQT